MDFLFTIAGFLVGFVIGMTGVGGGSLMTPILVLGFSIPPAIAVGTDLLYAAITKSVGVFAHQKQFESFQIWKNLKKISTTFFVHLPKCSNFI